MGTKERFYVDIMAAQQEVTGSCILFVVKLPNDETIRFIVDFGLFQEKEYQAYNQEALFKAEQLDFVIITHNHVDHMGRVPKLYHDGYDGLVYATKDTCTLMHIGMDDNYKIEKWDAKRNNRKALYHEEDVHTAKEHLHPCQFERFYQLHPSVNAMFVMNGHLPGAASVELEIHYPGYESIYLDVMGDYKPSNAFFDVRPIPEKILKRNVITITESTYGDTDTTDVKSVFEQNLLQALQEDKTPVLLVYSLGRAQEILYLLKSLQEQGKLDVNIPIGYDGNLSKHYTNAHKNGRICIKEEMQDFMPQNVTWVDADLRDEFMTMSGKKIIVTTSGNGNFGPAQQYLAHYIPREDALIHFTGFTPEGTAGAELAKAEVGDIVKIGGMMLPKKAKVEYTGEFSAHAKADELIERIKVFEHHNAVLVTHGPAETQQIFAKRVVKEVEPKLTAILNREYFYRFNAYGMVKMLPTKFR